MTNEEQELVERVSALIVKLRRPLWVFTAAHGLLVGESGGASLRRGAVTRRTHAAVELERIIHNYVMDMRDGEDASR